MSMTGLDLKNGKNELPVVGIMAGIAANASMGVYK